MPEGVSGPDVEPAPQATARYGFGGVLADAWDLFTSHLGLCLGIFAAFHSIAAAASFLILVAASSLGEAALIPARLTAVVVVPLVAGSLAVAALSSRLGPAAGPDQSPPRGSGLLRPDVLGMTLVAAMAGVAAVVVLQGPALVVLPFFYGPPVAMQLVVGGDLRLVEALQAARAMLAGSWNTLLYLFAVALSLGILGLVGVGALIGLAGGRDNVPTIAALSIGSGLLVGSLAAFQGAMQIAIFRRLRERSPAAIGAAASPD